MAPSLFLYYIGNILETHVFSNSDTIIKQVCWKETFLFWYEAFFKGFERFFHVLTCIDSQHEVDWSGGSGSKYNTVENNSVMSNEKPSSYLVIEDAISDAVNDIGSKV